MRAVVTGGHGFAGTHLLAHLRAMGDEVTAMDRSGPAPVDVTDPERVHERIVDLHPDVVYHLAAFTHVGESFGAAEEVWRVNVDGTSNVLAACRDAHVERVIVVGSSEEYGVVDSLDTPLTETSPIRPTSPYARSKVRAETLALDAFVAHGLPVVCARPFSHTGPGQSPSFLVPALASRIVAAERDEGDTVRVGNLDAVRDYSDVRDVVRAYRLLAERGEPGSVYNVCSGRGVTVAEIADGLLAQARRPLRLVVDPDLVRTTDVPVLVGDGGRLRAATGWQPEVPLEQTLSDVLAAART
ncbi:MAG TPA: GDP-mannose 4,6-dehydratase [Acidimicrobiia bacterium]